jgi:post-segregation antitoxin (ccd killing protein)
VRVDKSDELKTVKKFKSVKTDELKTDNWQEENKKGIENLDDEIE